MEYKNLLGTVLEVCCMTEADFLKSNRQDHVDARAMVVHILIEGGYSERYVSKVTGFSQQRVNSLKNGFKYRRSYELTMNLQAVHKRLLEEQAE
jgi:transposase